MDPAAARLRHLEPTEPARRWGPWRIALCDDLVADRRVLRWQLRHRSIERVNPDVLRLRARITAALGEATVPVEAVRVDGSRVELVTAPVAPVDLTALEPNAAREALERLAAALNRLESLGLGAGPVSGALVRDESGTYRLSPGAVVLPPVAALDALFAPARGFGDALAGEPAGRVHGEILRRALREVASTDPERRDVGRLAALADDVVGRERPAQAVLDALRGRGGTPGRAASGGRDDARRHDGSAVAHSERAIARAVEAAARAVREHRAVEVIGACPFARRAVLDGVVEQIAAEGVRVERPSIGRARAHRRRGGAAVVVDDAWRNRCAWPHLAAAIEDPSRGALWSNPPEPGEALRATLRRGGAGIERIVLDVELVPPRGAVATALARVGDALEPPHELDAAVARLHGRLGTRARSLLEQCAVGDAPLPLDVLSPVIDEASPQELAGVLELAGARVIELAHRSRSGSRPVRVTFDVPDERIRCALRHTLGAARCRALHRGIARAAESTGALDAMTRYAHLCAGGDDEAAARVAAVFVRSGTRDERAAWLDVLARDAAHGRFDSLDPATRLATCVRVADDLVARGDHALAEPILAAARSVAFDADDLPDNAATLAHAARLLATVWDARSRYRDALDLLLEARDDLASHLPLPEQARLMNEIAWTHFRLGEYDRAAEACRLALHSLTPNEHPIEVAQALNVMGVICFHTSRYDEAIAYYERVAMLREREGDRLGLAGTYNNLALALQARGEYDRALENFERSLRIKREENNAVGVAGGYMNQAMLYLEVHDYERAERLSRRSMEIAREIGMTQLVAENHGVLGDIAFRRGRHDEAEADYRTSLDVARTLETPNEELNALRRLARLYLDTGRTDDAERALATAVVLVDRIGSHFERARIEELLGDLDATRGRDDDAIAHFEASAREFSLVSRHQRAATVLARAGHALLRRGRTREARGALDRARDQLRSGVGSEIPDDVVTLARELNDTDVAARERAVAIDAADILQATRELAALADLAGDATAVATRAPRVAADVLRAREGWTALRRDDEWLRVDASGRSVPLVDPDARVFVDRAATGATILVADERGGVRVGIPLRAGGVDAGVLVVEGCDAPPSADAAEFLAACGRQVAAMLRTARDSVPSGLRDPAPSAPPGGDDAVWRRAGLVGEDPAMRAVFRTIEKIKDMDTGILIIGESGTGKTALARAIHENSPRRQRAFQQIHCAEIPVNLLESELFGHEKGAFTGATQRKLGRCEVADGGTIFLDDVNVMPLDTQAKLLNYLESKSFTRLGGTRRITTDVRVIAASNERLEDLVRQKRFREDLYYRLRVVQIDVPPLRERPEDLAVLCSTYLRRRCAEQNRSLKTLSAETMKLFRRYAWPGNVRELQNVLEQIVLLCDDEIVEPSALPEDFLRRVRRPARHPEESLETLVERIVASGDYSPERPLMPRLEAIVARKMTEHVENKSRAAAMLGITRPTLYNRLKRYDPVT